MQQSLLKHITTFLFLVTFLIPRVADVHAFSHLSDDDESSSCELCDIVSHSQNFDLFINSTSYDDVLFVNNPSSFIVSTHYNSPLAKIVTPISVYNKPPPFFLIG